MNPGTEQFACTRVSKEPSYLSQHNESGEGMWIAVHKYIGEVNTREKKELVQLEDSTGMGTNW